MKQPTEPLEFYEAELQEVGKKINRTHTKEQKERFMGELKMYAMEKGYKQGWAQYQYREKYGVWGNDPRIKNAKPKPVTDLVLGFIKHQAIKRRKGRGNAL